MNQAMEEVVGGRTQSGADRGYVEGQPAAGDRHGARGEGGAESIDGGG